MSEDKKKHFLPECKKAIERFNTEAAAYMSLHDKKDKIKFHDDDAEKPVK